MKLNILTVSHIEIGEKSPFRMGISGDGVWLTGNGHQIWRHKFTRELFITANEPTGEFSEEFEFICQVPDHNHFNALY